MKGSFSELPGSWTKLFGTFTKDSRGIHASYLPDLGPPRSAHQASFESLLMWAEMSGPGRPWVWQERCETLRETLIKHVNSSRNRAKQLRPTPRELGERSFQSWNAGRKSWGLRGPPGCMHRRRAQLDFSGRAPISKWTYLRALWELVGWMDIRESSGSIRSRLEMLLATLEPATSEISGFFSSEFF